MSVSMDQLESFVAAAEQGSFSGAARLLKKAQSAVSTHVANLEAGLGIALFDRAGRNPVLTEAGARLLPEAKLILDRREHLIGVASSFEAHVEKRLVVAIDELYPESAVGELFAEFAGRFPHVELELLFPIMEDVSRLVLDGKADVGVMWRQEHLPPELGFKTIGWVPLQLVCGKNHPLAHGRVDWEELKRHRQIMVTVRNEGTERHRLRVAAEVWWVESHWVILQILKQGVGWALIPAHIMASSQVADELAIPELEFDEGAHPVALEVVWHKQRPAGPAAKWLRRRFATRPPMLRM
ncbi:MULTISPECIES: LysR family transcriptional regulator [Bradyrhizobium]|jgi:DNA-binding transcriptional LysR family regulator|uniref:LysR family transcriptional regulator n=1 Tax=Bradyrhizobium TaxID=374 RepID=UPI00048953E8|nr:MULTISPECIES: LysR family transcriptional regulator [Bradyrhizobium]MCS3450779.1 DNA-binding transcriptional LysR family regulator [Bradyrhizobium elkanii]MCS3558076.1 DNA-binding transcriptional LysR family regulator [Bradyrhizobium elkanii]MCW2152077.1 DNA-binding transcriptional LysR family regulator [Bradyrhizobium elkanii]MCW2358047.1 DNA-binding transcriptional LysR family regulator [Bradyrhizobium elkanii]MCW2375808.1 DNA-binding transcriptional LysR family regulator [Bradyrhizobium 